MLLVLGFGKRMPIWIPPVQRGHHGVAIGPRTGFGIVYGKGAAGGVQRGELFRAVVRGFAGENQIADVRDALAFANAEIHLAGTRVDAHRLGLAHELGVEVLRPGEAEDGVFNVGVREHGLGADNASAFGDDAAGDFFAVALLDQNAVHKHAFTKLDPVFLELVGHLLDQQIRTALKGENPRAHEVAKHDAEGDRGVVEGGAVGVGNRLHQQAVHVRPPGEKPFEHLPRGLGVVVVVVHRPQVVVEGFDLGRGQLELFNQDAGVVFARERGPHIHLRIHEPHVFELVDGVGDFLGPVAPAALDHTAGKAVQRNIKNVPAFAGEPRREAAELIVVFEQEDFVAGLGQDIGPRQTAQAGAYDNHVVFIRDTFEPIVSHEKSRATKAPPASGASVASHHLPARRVA